jgi:hypothetical protein
MEKRTLSGMYRAAKKQPTPARSLLIEISRLTHKKEDTVKHWVLGYQDPDDLSKAVLAEHFGIPADELFPTK